MEKYTPELRARLMDRETSIRSQIACPGGGTIITLGFPGLAFDMRGDTYIDRDRMTATLSAVATSACRLLVVLVERDEVPDIAWPMLTEIAAGRSLDVLHLPIRDYEAPDDGFLDRWATIAPRIAATLEASGSVALSCHYGAGRSGTIAASLLIDKGLTAQAAITHVRGQFADSIESRKQIEWLETRATSGPLASAAR